MLALAAKFFKTLLKTGHVSICYTLVLALSVSPNRVLAADLPSRHSEEPYVQLKTQDSEDHIRLEVEDPIPADRVTEEKINLGGSLLMLTPEVYLEFKEYLDTRLWQPIKLKTSEAIGYIALNIPKVAKNLKRAFQNPYASKKNVTIVTTVMGVTSTLTAFSIGNIMANDASLMRLVATGILILGASGTLRVNYKTLSDFLNYRGWTLKDIKNVRKLREGYERKKKHSENVERPAGLEDESFHNRLLKVGLVELFFLATVDSWDFIFPRSELTKEFFMNFAITTVGYTSVSTSDAVISRKLIEATDRIQGSDPKEVQIQRNKTAFKYISLSIGVSFIQNLLAIPAIGGSGYFQAALFGIGGTMIAYDYFSGLKIKSRARNSCVAVFNP